LSLDALVRDRQHAVIINASKEPFSIACDSRAAAVAEKERDLICNGTNGVLSAL